MSNTSLEIIHEGWLTKSPPSKPIWRARWRRRWFVLRHSGELPGQYFLEYYTDHNCRKLKGKIDLDQCEQVDAGLRFENRKQKYQHMFDVKTPKRVYYLAAESEEDMNKWVEYVCHVCGLKAYKDEDDYDYTPPAEDEEPPTTSEPPTNELQDPILGPVTESPPVSPTSTISGPYIPISECISGRSLSSPYGLEDFNNILRQGGYGITASAQYGLTHKRASQSTWQKHALCSENENRGSTRLIGTAETGPLLKVRTPVLPIKRPPRTYDGATAVESAEFYDSPRKLHPPNLEIRHVSGTPPLQSPATDGESVFTDEEWSVPLHNPPSVNWETFPDGDSVRQTRPSDSSAEVDVGGGGDVGSWCVMKRFGKLTVVDSASSIPRDGHIGGHGRQLSLPTNLQHQAVAPPRPPKPFHLLLEAPSHNYLNLENVSPQPRHNRNIRKPSVASLSSDTSKRTGVPGSPNECVSASDGNEEPPSPLSLPQCNELLAVNDEMYDFPRSHQYANNPSSPSALDSADSKIQAVVRHCYTNAAPSKVNGEVFRYDFHHNDSPFSAPQEGAITLEEPVSPHSDGSSSLASSCTAAVYSNLPSPLTTQAIQSGTDVAYSGTPAPPAVNRGLKPGRKLSDSASVVSSEPSPVSPAAHLLPGHLPPSVDRKLKPQLKLVEQDPLPLAAPPACWSGSENSRNLKKPRAAPSPTLPSSAPTTLRNGHRQHSEHNSSSDDDHRNSPDEPIYYYRQDNKFVPATRFQELQYLDLDLDCDPGNSGTPTTQSQKAPERMQTTSTVYKTVDFVKTVAFNRTRQEVEEVRKQCTAAADL